ncbi:MAG: endonuclease III, partial [Oscillospiraceae bacterium]|nr:endonuclease III [Oscillospiraceae bacterium]
MTKKEKAVLVCERLKEKYPEAVCSLVYDKPYELLIATRLSAQCTDARVNIVTKDLFAKYPTLQSFADASLTELEEIVKPCGFYRNKAKSIKEMAALIISDHNGEVPDTMEKLTSLPGVGRKTANLILGDVYGKPAIVTDTHCIRITGRLGLTNNTEQHKVENDLRK